MDQAQWVRCAAPPSALYLTSRFNPAMSLGFAQFRPHAFLLSTWAVNVCLNAFYISPAAVFPQMIGDLGITKAQAGSLISFYLLSILLFQIPGGYVIDRIDPRKIVVASALSVFAMSFAMSLAPRYDVLLALRTIAGIPVAFIFVPSAFLVSRAFDKTPGRAVGMFLSSPPAGVALGNLLSPVLATSFGWPAVYVAFNIPLLALLPLFARHSSGLPSRTHESFTLADYITAFRNKELWKVGLAFGCSYAAYIFYSSWSPTYLENSGLIAVALIGMLSAAIPAAGIISRPLGGHLAETVFSRDKRMVPSLAFAFLLLVSVLIPFAGLGALPLLVASGFLAQFPFSVYYLFSTQIMPRRFSGTAYAFMNTASLIGGSISPGLGGLLVDLTGSFLAAFAMMAVNALLGLILVVRVRER